MRRAANCRFREYIRETAAEYQRRGNYIRIYPAKGCDMYDNLFQGPRPYNRAVYKALFTDEVVKTGPLTQAVIQNPMQRPPQSDSNKSAQQPKESSQSAYDNYKKQQQEKAENKKQEESMKLKK